MFAAIRKWVIQTMMKGQTGVVQTLPKREIIELNTQITAERMMRNGINPQDMKTVGQVENVINQIDQPKVIQADSAEGRGITEKLVGKKKADVMDMEGNKIDTSKGIMGGKEVPTSIDQESFLSRVNKAVQENRKSDAAIKARLDAGNKKGIAGIKNRQLTEDEYQDFLDEVGGADQLEAYNFDGTVGDAKRIIKEQKDYMAQMKMEYRKGKLDPEPGSRTPQRKRFLQKKLEEAEASGDARLLSREEREELFDLDDIPEYADGGRIGLKAGMTKRAFMKLMGGVGASIGAAKSGIFSGFGKGAGKEVAKEVVQQTTTSTPPPYFFKLAEKIKMMGNDATATTERVIAKSLKSKDGKSEYLLEEDMVTGDTIIKKINKEGDEMITDVQIMELRKGEDVITKDGKAMKTPDEYEEVTEANARIEGDVYNDPYYSDGIEVDEMKKIIDEVDDKVPSIKYASGGLAYMLGE
mgnify:CR=1 FL=1